MRLLRLLCALALSVLSCLIVFSGESIDVYASTYTGGGFLTVSETLQAFGSSIEVTYFNGSEYVDTNATYVNSLSPTWRDTLAVLDYPELMQGTLLHYTANLNGINSNNSYITLRLYPQYSIFDTSKIYTYIAIKSYGVSPAAYQSPSWRWFWDGQEINVEPFSGYNGTYYPRFENFNGDPYVFIPVRLDSQSLTSGYSLSAQFMGGVLSSCDIYIQCPYVSIDAYGSSGTFTSTTGLSQGDINVDVNVDLTETNTLLGGISDLIGGLVDGIADLFIPEQNTIIAFENALADLLLDTFGGIESDMLDDVIQDLLTHGATESITWPAISVPGTNFSLPSYNVPLKPHAVQGRALYEAVALAVDLMATSYVINLIMHNIKVFLVGEKVVEIEDAD